MGGVFPVTSGSAGNISAADRRADVSPARLQSLAGSVVARWVETPYDQHFTGETFFQRHPSIDPSSMSRWRKRIGEEGVEWLLTKAIEAARSSGAVTEPERVSVDTTVMEKNIAHPTDARLYERARRQLVALAAEAGLSLP